MSGSVEDSYQNAKLFNQFNHPSRKIFKYISEKILKVIDIDNTMIEDIGVDYLDMIITPIYISTYKNLNLKFKENFNIYRGKMGSELLRQDVVNYFFDFYETMNKEELIRYISKTKPFIPQIIDSLV